MGAGVGVMRLPLTSSQVSALECSDLADTDEFKFDGDHIHYRSPEAVVERLTELANSQDDLAAHMKNCWNHEGAKMARGARDSLTNLAAKVRGGFQNHACRCCVECWPGGCGCAEVFGVCSGLRCRC